MSEREKGHEVSMREKQRERDRGREIESERDTQRAIVKENERGGKE